MTPIREGAPLPDLPLTRLGAHGPETVRSADLFEGRTVILFGLPGAFTPTCSGQHLPRYETLADAFRAQGIDDIFCISVNDPYVMAAWAAEQGLRRVSLLADGDGRFTSALGLLEHRVDSGMGARSRRYSMLARGGRVARLFLEPEGGYGRSDADTLFACLAPAAAPLPKLAMISKPGCPHCSRVRRALQKAGLPFTELEVPDARRAGLLEAIAGEMTAPQVFADGRRIGGESQVLGWLRTRATAPARSEKILEV